MGDDVETCMNRNKYESVSFIHMLQNNVNFLVLVQ
jgi:hypothetical protein